MDIWDLFDCLQTYKKIINEEEEKGGKNIVDVVKFISCMMVYFVRVVV